jgi:hypothetical protein
MSDSFILFTQSGTSPFPATFDPVFEPATDPVAGDSAGRPQVRSAPEADASATVSKNFLRFIYLPPYIYINVFTFID